MLGGRGLRGAGWLTRRGVQDVVRTLAPADASVLLKVAAAQ